jgi:hypothetical protein
VSPYEEAKDDQNRPYDRPCLHAEAGGGANGHAGFAERLGGVYSIATVVDDLIDRVMADPRLNANSLVTTRTIRYRRQASNTLLLRSFVPRGTSFHRWVDSQVSSYLI